MKILQEFREFLKEYKIVGLTIAFVMGVASTSLIKSLVDNMVMPAITGFIPGAGWRTATFSVGPVVIGWGAFLGDLLNFVIIAFLVFIVVKKVLKEDKAKKK